MTQSAVTQSAVPQPTALRVIFFGTPHFASIGLEALNATAGIEVKLVVTQPDKPTGRGEKLRPTPVKEVAMSRNIPVLQPFSLKRNQDEVISQLSAHGPFDIGVVIAFGQILPQRVLDLPRKGCVNVHGSLLPRWRGAAPIQRAIMAGDATTGIALMQMDAGLDTGPVYCSESTPISASDTFASLHDRLATIGATLLSANLARIANGTITATPQPAEGVTYANKISEQEAQIVWTKPATELQHIIHGLSPSPGAYTQLMGKRLKILAAEAKQGLVVQPTPGRISFIDKARLEVECGTGVLSLLEVQLEGRKRMSVGDFLRGTKIDSGAILGA